MRGLVGADFAGDVAVGCPGATLALQEGVPKQVAIKGIQLRYDSGISLSRRSGTELEDSLKNIYAIAAGLCDGLGLGDNAKAALLTRSMHEMIQLGVSLGQSATFSGLSGFGDLIATCTGDWSRTEVWQLLGKDVWRSQFWKSKIRLLRATEQRDVRMEWPPNGDCATK